MRYLTKGMYMSKYNKGEIIWVKNEPNMFSELAYQCSCGSKDTFVYKDDVNEDNRYYIKCDECHSEWTD